MKKKKLSIEKLQVSSFITDVERKDLVGGAELGTLNAYCLMSKLTACVQSVRESCDGMCPPSEANTAC